MKKLVFLALVASLLTSCSSQDSSSPRAFADKFIEAEHKAWATGNLEDLKALESTSVVYHLPEENIAGWKSHEEYILQARQRISDLKQNWKYLSGEGNHFAMSYQASAVAKSDGTNPAATISTNNLFVFRLENGRIAEVWTNGTTTNAPVEGTKN
jgi:ketosteroid isomerase-like protein